MIATDTTIDAPTKIHGARCPRLNAPPEFVVNRRSSTPGMTVIGGRPASACSTQTLVSRSRSQTARRDGEERCPPSAPWRVTGAYRRDCAWASLMQRSTYGSAFTRAFSMGFPQMSQMP